MGRTAGSPASLSAAIRDKALDLGFDAVGIAPADANAAAGDRLRAFLSLGRHGAMDWMETTAERRAHVNALWPDARSAVVVGANYGPTSDPLADVRRPNRGVIAAYARGRDYHVSVKRRIRRFATWIYETHEADVKVFVDTAPLMEKPLAERAGLGWQGKHTNLVSREFGSWLVLGVVLTTLDLEPDAPVPDACGACTRCLDVCPTNAFPAPYQLDARRCISYLTIEHPGHIAREFREAIGNRVFGCDDCLAVCPWNKYAQAAHASLRQRIELAVPLLRDFAGLDEASFEEVFAGSPVKRTGRDRFVRNVAIAIGNAGDASLVPVAQRLLDDASPLVRAMAVWALSRLDAATFAEQRAARAATEPDEHVRAEWYHEESPSPAERGRAGEGAN